MLGSLPRRIYDAWGFGHYLAPRGNGREHNGQDFLCYPGTVITSHVDGQVTKIGYPYSDDTEYRYVQISDADGNRHRVFYVDPWLEVGDMVYAYQTPVGESQNISERYPATKGRGPMGNHVHYEVMHPYLDEVFFDPNDFLKEWVRP